MSYGSKKEYIQLQKRRYRHSGKARKTCLLDEVCAVCDYDRKYAINVLNGTLAPSSGKRGRKSQYRDPELVNALKTIWL